MKNLDRLKKSITQKASLPAVLGLALIVFSLLTISSCNKLNVLWVKYDETQCADSWDYSENNEVLKTNIESYLKTKGVKVLEMEIFVDADPQMNCSACSCKTGRIIKIKIKKRELDDAKSQGFYE